jgi:hypothetical protein
MYLLVNHYPFREYLLIFAFLSGLLFVALTSMDSLVNSDLVVSTRNKGNHYAQKYIW